MQRNWKARPNLNVSACCVSTSVSVNASIVCTPGASARNDIRTDWHVAGRNGLSLTRQSKVGSQENEERRGTTDAPNTHTALQWQDPRSPACRRTSSMRMTLPSPPALPNAHFESPRPYTLIKHKYIQRKLIMRHQSARTRIGPAVHADAHDDTLALRDCRCCRSVRRMRL